MVVYQLSSTSCVSDVPLVNEPGRLGPKSSPADSGTSRYGSLSGAGSRGLASTLSLQAGHDFLTQGSKGHRARVTDPGLIMDEESAVSKESGTVVVGGRDLYGSLTLDSVEHPEGVRVQVAEQNPEVSVDADLLFQQRLAFPSSQLKIFPLRPGQSVAESQSGVKHAPGRSAVQNCQCGRTREQHYYLHLVPSAPQPDYQHQCQGPADLDHGRS